MPSVSIGIGSNINAERNLAACAQMMRAVWPNARFSSVFTTAPRDREDQEDFLNAVARIETDESPEHVHAVLTRIEHDLGKHPPFAKGPRTIDLDILLYGDEVRLETSSSTPLAIPHPRMHERRFVLEPLCELIDPNMRHPTIQQTFGELREETASQRCIKTDIAL